MRERLAAWQPDSVVLVLFLGNDLHDNFSTLAASAVPQFSMSGARLQYEPAPTYDMKMWLRDNVLARSAFMRLFWIHVVKENARIKQLARAMGMVSTPELPPACDPVAEAEMMQVAKLQLAEIAEFLPARRIPLVAYVIPDPFRVRAVIEGKVDLRRTAAEEAVLSTLEEHGVPWVYPRDLFAERITAGEVIYRNSFGHFTTAAHALSADLLEPLVWEHSVAATALSNRADRN